MINNLAMDDFIAKAAENIENFGTWKIFNYKRD